MTWLARGYENAFTVDVPGCSELVGLHRWTTSTGRKLALLLVVDLGEDETPYQIPGKLRLVAVDVDTAQIVLAPGETPVERHRALPISAQFPGGDLLWTWAESGLRKVYLERFRPELRFRGLARL